MENVINIETDLNSGIAAFEAKNFPQAYKLLSPYIDSSIEARYRVGMMQLNALGMVKNEKKGFENLKQAAKDGHKLSYHMIAVCYMQGEGVEKNIKNAIKWFEKAADIGLEGAIYTLAMIYEDGMGVKKNPEKAKYWLNKANQQ